MTSSHIKKISSIVSVFETGKADADYELIALLKDGPDKIRQITYGKHQTTEFGNLKKLLSMYVIANGSYASYFKPYVDAGVIGKIPSLCTNVEFLIHLKKAGTDPVMQATQDIFFEMYYLEPSAKFFYTNKFTFPLSMLVIYDSYVHSGGIPGYLRDDFREVTPAKGGDEKAWVTAYVYTRDKWLEAHSNKLLQNTDYRTDSFILAIRSDNWDLGQPFKVVNYANNDESGTPIVRFVVP
jgi:chitosanase